MPKELILIALFGGRFLFVRFFWGGDSNRGIKVINGFIKPKTKAFESYLIWQNLIKNHRDMMPR